MKMNLKSRFLKTLMKRMRIAYAILGNDMGYANEDEFTKFAKYSKLTQCFLLIPFSVFVTIYASIYGFPPFTSLATSIELAIPLSNICFLTFDAIHHNFSLRFSKELHNVKLDLIKYRKYIDTSKVNYVLFFYQTLGLMKASTHILNFVYFSSTREISLPMFFVIWFLTQPLTSIMILVHCCSLLVLYSYYRALNEVISILNETKFEEQFQMEIINVVGRNHVKLSKILISVLRKQKFFVKYFFILSMTRILWIEYLFIVLSLRNNDELGIGIFLDLFDVMFNSLFTIFCVVYAYEKVNAEKIKTKDILEEIVMFNQDLYSYPRVQFYLTYISDQDPLIDTDAFLPINCRICLWYINTCLAFASVVVQL